ncbi:MAG: MBL fold metallo-hydrolase, partial [Polyangiaceae bacterium]|nr:MBL fold metallo-hydrolase [Polyangiaceae bacterium]
MRIAILGSGSKGNAALVEAGGTRLLLDAGIALRTLEERMVTALGAIPEAIHGIVITHAHRDHAQHAPAYAERFGCPVYVSESTQRGVRWEQRPKTFVVARTAPFRIGAIEVSPFPVPHDAPQVALVVESGGAR